MPQLSGLSLVCGLALIYGIAEYFKTNLETLYKKGIRLKWPNDVLVNSAKLSGILVEGGQAKPQDPIWMIIGIGLNLKSIQIPENKPDYAIGNLSELFPNATSLNTSDVWHSLAATFLNTFDEFNEQGFSAFKDDWNRWNAFANQAVELRQDGQVVQSGICQGVDDLGALLINSGGLVKTIHNGELSLRLNS